MRRRGEVEAGSGLILEFPAGREFGREFLQLSGHSGDGWRQFTLRFQGVKRKLANVLPDRRRESCLPGWGILSAPPGMPPLRLVFMETIGCAIKDVIMREIERAATR
jgi:hypothetical protein